MRYGWSYSLFAGIVALPFVLLLFGAFGHFLPMATAEFTLGAIVAARLGAWLGLLCGGRDHGLRATAFTFVTYIYLCGAGVVASDHYRFPVPKELASFNEWSVALNAGTLQVMWVFLKESFASALLVGLTMGWLILIACLVGVLLFDAVLRKQCRVESNPA